jgi:hypothetical protein
VSRFLAATASAQTVVLFSHTAKRRAAVRTFQACSN